MAGSQASVHWCNPGVIKPVDMWHVTPTISAPNVHVSLLMCFCYFRKHSLMNSVQETASLVR